ncbi:hypothetical protein [Streptococcus dysgalactiae]|uniref:hypothetical protein n=1 Tax=Streptococcus dysgalactiae TaxID=1334 RepID=UPI003D7B65EC
MQYIAFFRQFEEQIESHVSDGGQRLTFLSHYCQGKAKEAIHGCLLYPAAEGYIRARAILKELYGERHFVVRAMLDEVTKPGPIATDAESLSSYANKLVNCADALLQLGFLADLNSFHTLELVLRKLPRLMIADWVKRSDEFYQKGHEPVFRDLCEFVVAKARLQRNRYSNLLHDQKVVVEPLNNRVAVKNTYTVSIGEGVCHNCQGKHSLKDCKDSLALSCGERWSLGSRHRLCFVCLIQGHRADRCRSKEFCSENDFGR